MSGTDEDFDKFFHDLLDSVPTGAEVKTHRTADRSLPASVWIARYRTAIETLDELYERGDLIDRRLYHHWWSDAVNEALEAREQLDRLDYLGEIDFGEVSADDARHLSDILGSVALRGRIDFAAAHIQAMLSYGPVGTAHLKWHADNARMDRQQFDRARVRLGVQTRHVGPPGREGRSVYCLPQHDPGDVGVAVDPG